jgi:hypothetical protein
MLPVTSELSGVSDFCVGGCLSPVCLGDIMKGIPTFCYVDGSLSWNHPCTVIPKSLLHTETLVGLHVKGYYFCQILTNNFGK